MTVFDIIGPIMVGPSSSHTAGAVRLGRVAWKMLDEAVKEAHIKLSGSFATTGRGHGTDRAILAGCMGMHSYNEEIRDAFEIAKQKNIDFTFENVNLPDAHPNTAIIHLLGVSGKETTIQGASVGGGNIIVTNLNGIDIDYDGKHTAILVQHVDKPGCIAAVTNFMFYADVNICSFRMSRTKKGGEAIMMIEVDGDVPQLVKDNIKLLPNVTNTVVIRAL